MTVNDIDTVETTVEPIAETVAEKVSPLKRISKRGWIIIGAGAGVLIAAAAIALPIVGENVAKGNALDELTASEAALTDAQAELVAAYDSKHTVIGEVPTVYTDSGALAGIARPDILADAATLDELQSARTALLEVAGVTVDGENFTVPEAEVADKLPATVTPSSISGIEAQTKKNVAAAAELTAAADKASDEAADVEAAAETVVERMEGVVASGAEFGAAFTGFEKGAAESRENLAAFVTAMADEDKPLIERFQGYVGAYDGLKASHDEVVAAEQAAAEEAARQEAARQQQSQGGGSNGGSTNRGGSTGGGSNGGGSTNTGGGSTGGGSTNTGGGSTGGGSNGGSTGGGSTGGGSNGGGSTNTTPAKFQTGANYVSYSGRCSFYTSHNVGFGGTSTSAGSMDALGAPWSATVNGGTVTYYLCD